MLGLIGTQEYCQVKGIASHLQGVIGISSCMYSKVHQDVYCAGAV